MNEKSILEQALLQVQTLEEAVKANAKGILASTMKQELNELLKESMEEEEEVTTTPEEEEDDMSDDATTPEGEEATDDETDDTNLDNEDPTADTETDDESGEFPTDEFGPEEGSEDDEVLDMTGASHDEVLKVFRAMKPEDGIVVKKDGNTIEVSTGDDEFIIKLDDEGTEDDALPTDELPVDSELPVDDELPSDDSGSEFPSDEFSDEGDTDDEEGSDETSDEFSDETSDDDSEDDDQLAESKSKSKPFGDGSKKAGKNGPFTGAKKAGKDGPYTGGKKEMKEGDVEEGEVKEDAKPYGTGTKKAGKNGPFTGAKKAGKDGPYTGKAKEVKEEDSEETVYEIELDGEEGDQTESARTIGNGYHAGLKSKNKWKAGNKREEINEEVEKLRNQNAEYKKALVLFKEKLNEVAVFNANLAYFVNLVTENTTTKQEKLNILKRFDSASTMNESKTLFKTIQSELETKKPVTETVANKISSTPSTSSSTEVLAESKAYENPQFRRMKDLMNKIK